MTVMAIFCLSNDLEDLEKRIGNITIGYTRDKKPVYAKDLNAQGPMTVLLKEAIRPNVTQTLENNWKSRPKKSKFGMDSSVEIALNEFPTDTDNEICESSRCLQ